MTQARPLILAFVAALALSACSESAPPAAPAEPVAPAAPVASAPVAAPAEVTASGDSVGIAACDDYLTKYESCIANKVPAETRAALKTSLDQTRDAWRAAIAAGTATNDLETACKAMSEGAKASMSAFGCTDF